MNVSDAIRTRRSVKLFKDTEPLDRETVESLIEAATWAPNHYFTEPWKFFVVQGEGREQLSDVMRKWATAKADDPGSPEAEKRIMKVAAKPMLAPTIIIVVLSRDLDNKKAVYTEDVCAVAAAVQNLLLEAHSKGIGAIWKSGAAYHAEPVKDFFKLRQDEEILGAVFLGESDMRKDVKVKRIPHREKTEWITGENQ
ncbi:nitroreductase family protein [Lacicoccus alkaliphilus]|uniref:Putative NAD(P)H nitroreductase n=1 Tax=Lacicoccus alkaliphilus DSM 16010 TaxID=1123231 RepID=A0A1M7H8Q2_9BACL|nr:nitroreductase [Salinicoccus alkaliphilus]SHM24746.1 Nitroreductase [Salinicoccus alkaliphilus DSM 16010]